MPGARTRRSPGQDPTGGPAGGGDAGREIDGMQTTSNPTQAPQQQLSEIRPGRYVIDPASSAITFRTRHMFGLGRVRGTFAIRGGAVEITGQPGEARCYAEIDAASFRTGNPQRDASVRSARLLDTDHHPVIIFEAQRLDGTGPDSTGPDSTGPDSTGLTGQLTVRGVTRPAAIAAELT